MLSMGRSFNRNYRLRLPFIEGFYDIGLFYNIKSPFLLFSLEGDTSSSQLKHSVKINMYKNVESSRFSETFLNLNNYKSYNLDIINQFKEIKDDYLNDVNFILNETLTLSKIRVDDNVFLDQLMIYGLTLSTCENEIIFLIAERQNISSKLRKKIVRTSAIQIATTNALKMVDEYFEESCKSRNNKDIREYLSNNDRINFTKLEEENKCQIQKK